MSYYDDSPGKRAPFIVVERGDCSYCGGKGERIVKWKDNRAVFGKCYNCDGAGKLDREIPLLDALRELGALIRGEV